LGFFDQGAKAYAIKAQVPAMVTGELTFGIRHKGTLVGAHLAHKIHQVVKRVAFDIELLLGPVFEKRGQVMHIIRSDVSLIGPGVDRDAMSTGLQAQGCRTDNTGNTQMAGVTDQGDLI
jgi:hypothetical protein